MIEKYSPCKPTFALLTLLIYCLSLNWHGSFTSLPKYHRMRTLLWYDCLNLNQHAWSIQHSTHTFVSTYCTPVVGNNWLNIWAKPFTFSQVEYKHHHNKKSILSSMKVIPKINQMKKMGIKTERYLMLIDSKLSKSNIYVLLPGKILSAKNTSFPCYIVFLIRQ